MLNESPNTANKTLRRLAASALVAPIRRGLWAVSPNVDPLLLPEYLTAPLPSYVSLQTALYRHGLVEQIPAVVYAVSLDRSRRITTPLGTFSIHRVAPEVFGGFDVGDDGVKLATPEKALFDIFYLFGYPRSSLRRAAGARAAAPARPPRSPRMDGEDHVAHAREDRGGQARARGCPWSGSCPPMSQIDDQRASRNRAALAPKIGDAGLTEQ